MFGLGECLIGPLFGSSLEPGTRAVKNKVEGGSRRSYGSHRSILVGLEIYRDNIVHKIKDWPRTIGSAINWFDKKWWYDPL